MDPTSSKRVAWVAALWCVLLALSIEGLEALADGLVLLDGARRALPPSVLGAAVLWYVHRCEQ